MKASIPLYNPSALSYAMSIGRQVTQSLRTALIVTVRHRSIRLYQVILKVRKYVCTFSLAYYQHVLHATEQVQAHF
jgi:hypothetical protein